MRYVLENLTKNVRYGLKFAQFGQRRPKLAQKFQSTPVLVKIRIKVGQKDQFYFF